MFLNFGRRSYDFSSKRPKFEWGSILYTDFQYISHHLLFILQGMDVKNKKPKQNTSGIGM